MTRTVKARLCLGLAALFGLAAGCRTPETATPFPTPTAVPASATIVPSPTVPPTATIAATAPACPVPADWEVTFEQTGGFAAVSLRLEVKSSGEAQASDLQSGVEAKFRLTVAERNELAEALPVVCAGDAGGRPPACADCFDYLVDAELDGDHYLIHTNDVDLEEHPGRVLLIFLRAMLEQALSAIP